MDDGSDPSGSAAGGPLQIATPDRMNQRREAMIAALRAESRDSPVLEKISQFNSLSAAMQSKQLERKTTDAALKRAMLGREEAELELRRLREENRQLQKFVHEGKERERKVGERLETVMEKYGRAKEMHAHTQALWEKEIRRTRKESFKTQSSLVKIQEDLKSARSAVKILEDGLQREKERSRIREQEAFTARYQIVGVQEQLEQAMERIKVVEQERDAFKTVAKNEEVARLAAEGRLPLPKNEDPNDEFASPKKRRIEHSADSENGRLSLSAMDIVSSAASELEIEELSLRLLWEERRADRAQDMVEFLQAECQMRCCPCSKSQRMQSSPSPPQKRRREAPENHPQQRASPEVEEERQDSPQVLPRSLASSRPDTASHLISLGRGARRSTIFCPEEGIFRTVSQKEADALESQRLSDNGYGEDAEAPDDSFYRDDVEQETETSVDQNAQTSTYARTPSVEPPNFAIVSQERASLQSLLNAPLEGHHPATTSTIRNVPTEPDDAIIHDADEQEMSPRPSPEPRPHTSTATYTVTTTTVPLRDTSSSLCSSRMDRLRTPSAGTSVVSFDLADPALTPTMTREQALAKIRERRGRVRSAALAAATPRKMAKGSVRREVSAPSGKTAGRLRA